MDTTPASNTLNGQQTPAAAHQSSPPPQNPPHKSKLSTLWVALIMFVVGVIGGVLLTITYPKTLNKPQSPQLTNVTPAPAQSSTPAPSPSADIAATPSSTTNLSTADWKTYTDSKYKYAITYPKESQISIRENGDLNIFIKGHEYPTGMYVEVDIIQNPKKLALRQLGNERFAADAPEPYDLNWKDEHFLDMTVLSTKHRPPGDSGEQTIYMFERNGIVYAIWKSPTDQSGSTTFNDLSTQILSTFKFTD